MADICPHCDHPLRSHRALPKPYADVMLFECAEPDPRPEFNRCLCTINGSVEKVG